MKSRINAPVVVGVVGHAEIEILPEVKRVLENIDGFRVIFFKTSSQKLYIREGGEH